MARHRVVRGGFRGPRRATDWIASSVETAFTALAGSTAFFDQLFSISEPATVVRTRGSIWVKSDQHVADEYPFGALGMAVVTDQAAAIGVTALPTPITDQGSDSFFLWQPWAGGVEAATSVGFDGAMLREYKFDSKAMRKIEDSDNIVVTMENSSTVGVDYLLLFRMLIKLHG